MNFKKFIAAVFIFSFPSCLVALPIVATKYWEEVSKIMRGLTASRGEFPYQALVMRDGHFICGGSILSKKFILSAAHCVETNGVVDDASRFIIAVGVHDRTRLSGGDVQILAVKNIIMHEEYNTTTNQNDIAVFELKEEIQFNKYVKPVNLPKINEDFTGSVIVSGWGWNEKNLTPLQKLKAPLVSNDECDRMWSNLVNYSRSITSEMICFGEPGRDVCGGDSGGPMMCRRSDNTSVQCGIVSFGKPCYISNSFWLPGVQTRVSSFVIWIDEVISGSLFLKQRIDRAEPLTTKSAEFLLKLAYEVEKVNDLNLKNRFPKSIQDLLWHSACRIKNIETGHYMKVVIEEQIMSNGNVINVYHIVGEDESPIAPNWKLYPVMIQNKLGFQIFKRNISKSFNDEIDQRFVHMGAGAVEYEIHFENDRVSSNTTQQPFYIYNPRKNVYFHEARRNWEPWRCGFNQFLDCLVASEPGKKYDEGKFILDECVEGDHAQFGRDGCRKKGTNILMADMTQKPVESLQVGDFIMHVYFGPAQVLKVFIKVKVKLGISLTCYDIISIPRYV